MSAAPSTRRERLRTATTREILEVARRHVVAEGPAATSLRAIAREMGMTAPALYRYFASRDELVAALVVSLYGELTDALEAARDAVPAEDLGGRLIATSRAFRQWSIGHPAEFGLVFGTPAPGYAAPPRGPVEEAGSRFGGVFQGIFAELWRRQPFPVRTEGELDPRLVAELREWLGPAAEQLPAAAAQVFLSCWARLYGIIGLEVFGHLDFALADKEPMFEAELADLARRLGVDDQG